METQPILVHALSPLHAGTGQATEVVDLPVARMKATGIPFVPGSSIKGVLRSRCPRGDAHTLAAFGPESGNASDHAGALVVGDARLLALPVRSFRGTFAWVSSPLLLLLARRDLPPDLPLPVVQARGALVGPNCQCLYQGKVFLEDLDLPAQVEQGLGRWTAFLAPLASPGTDILSSRFVVVDDDTMAFLWETGTQIDARVRIDPDTGTVARGALWLEESLPAETLLLGLLAAEASRRKDAPMSGREVLEYALPEAETLVQFGGKASSGHGRCRVVRAGSTLTTAPKGE
jgi:CRISPR-associated protein Cmr4